MFFVVRGFEIDFLNYRIGYFVGAGGSGAAPSPRPARAR